MKIRISPTALCVALMAAGSVFQLRQYLACRSLWIDEANLAVHVVTRSASQLLDPLASPQADQFEGLNTKIVPLGFLMTVKALTPVLGTSEYALRFLPLMASLCSLPLFWGLARRRLSPWIVPGAVALLSLNWWLIRHCDNFKAYTMDVLMSIVVLWTADLYRHGRLRPLGFTLIGLLLPWFSFPCVFPLAGLGVCMMASHLRDRDWKQARQLAWTGCVWLAGLLLLYLGTLGDVSDNQYLADFWRKAFMPPLFGKGCGAWLKQAFWQFTDFAVSDTRSAGRFLPALRWGLAILMGIAVAGLWRKDRQWLGLLLLPAAFALLASLLHVYPFAGRLSMFLIPIAILLLSAGVETIASLRPRVFLPLTMALWGILLWHPAKARLHDLATPRTMEEIRPLMEILHTGRHSHEPVYVYYAAVPAATYYRERMGTPDQGFIPGIQSRKDRRRYLQDLNALKGHRRVWVLFSHMFKKEEPFMVAHLETLGRRLAVFREPANPGSRRGCPMGVAPCGSQPQEQTAPTSAGVDESRNLRGRVVGWLLFPSEAGPRLRPECGSPRGTGPAQDDNVRKPPRQQQPDNLVQTACQQSPLPGTPLGG